MAKTKRLNVKQVEAELRLIVLGASGGAWNYPRHLTFSQRQSLFGAVRLEYLRDYRESLRTPSEVDLETNTSLAAFIVAERKRLDAKGEA